MNLKNCEKIKLLSDEELENVVGGEWKWENLETQQQVTYALCGGASALAGIAFIISVASLAFELVRNKIKKNK